MPTLRTHCSGGELFGIGARAAGYTHLDGFEINPKIAAVARANGFDVHTADVCGVDYASLPPSDHLHTSPSCKRASRANINAGETDEDLAVADSVCRAIRAHAGRTFSLENVIGYRWFESYDRIVQTLKDCGFVFRVVDKGGDAPTWRDERPTWNDAGEFVDAADFGVPQNRKRLILRAVRGPGRVPGLRPTHSARGGVLLDRWRGWYGAIEDLIDSLPETTPARWQLARLPIRTVTTDIVGGGNTQLAQVESHARTADLPMFTVSAGDGVRKAAAAYLLNDQNAGQEWGKGYRETDGPACTISASVTGMRAYTAGRWVRLTIQALSRFQTVPDDYLGLTAEINGNAVPPLLSQRIMESLLPVYAHQE